MVSPGRCSSMTRMSTGCLCSLIFMPFLRCKSVARHITKAQIAQAQHMAEDWTKRHTRRANIATSPDSTH